MTGQTVGVRCALQNQRAVKVVSVGIDRCGVDGLGLHRGDDGGEVWRGRDDVDGLKMLKQHFEVFGKPQTEYGVLTADEIARVLRRDDDDRFAVGAVDAVNLAEDGQRGVRFGNRLAEDDFAQLGEIDRARRCCAQKPQRTQAAWRGRAQHDIPRLAVLGGV